MNRPARTRTLARALLCAALCLAVLLPACASAEQTLQDGYYTAEMAEFDEYGWKEYLIICVREGKLVTADYNAKNASGLIKSWDMDYMRIMNAEDGTYPNEYTRIYSDALLSRQDPAKVDVIAGATHSHHTFQLLGEAALALARSGEREIAYVEAPPPEE